MILPVPIIDTREKIPYNFDSKYFAEAKNLKLDTGDYSLVGFEDMVAIERKRDVSEIANNIVEKRFEAWTSRLSQFKYPYIICEFDYDEIVNYPFHSNIPAKIKRRIKVRGPFITSKLIDLMVGKNIQIIFAGTQNRAATLTGMIMRKIYLHETGIH